ncbi:unnamed protein product, partial [Musa acuminata subsp. malaccensis]
LIVVLNQERRVDAVPKIHGRLGRGRRDGVPGGEPSNDGVAVRVAVLAFVEVEGVAHGVVAEPAAVPGPATEPADEGLPPGAGHGLGPLPCLEEGLPASAPPPAPRGRAPSVAPLRRRGTYPLPGLAGPRCDEGHPEAAAAALGELFLGRGGH